VSKKIFVFQELGRRRRLPWLTEEVRWYSPAETWRRPRKFVVS